MGKLIRIFERTQPINFLSPQNEYNLYRSSFLSSELGLIYQGIPWQELVLSFGLKQGSWFGQPFFTTEQTCVNVPEIVYQFFRPEADRECEGEHSLPDVLCDHA